MSGSRFGLQTSASATHSGSYPGSEGTRDGAAGTGSSGGLQPVEGRPAYVNSRVAAMDNSAPAAAAYAKALHMTTRDAMEEQAGLRRQDVALAVTAASEAQRAKQKLPSISADVNGA